MKGANGNKSSEASAPVTMFTAKSGGPARYEAKASTSTLTGGAGGGGCTLCSGGQKVGNIGVDASVTLNGITVPTTGIYLVKSPTPTATRAGRAC